MMRAREDRIRTFMQLELKACLEEVSWSIRCYNCEVLGCPQEEYPARLLPTLPPNYEDNLQSRLIMAQKGIFPASLKMILKSEYQLPVLRPVPEIPVHPDSVIGEHRAGENSTSSECDPSPRRAAVVTRSEEPETPPHSPAITTVSEPEVSQVETQMEDEFFSFEASTDGFFNKKFTSTEQEPALLHQQDAGVDDNEKETTTTTQQAAVRKEFVSPTEKQQQRGTTAWGTKQHKLFDRDRLLRCNKFSEKRIASLCTLSCILSLLFFRLYFFCRLSYFSALPPKQVRRRYELFGCTGCVNCCIHAHSPSRFFRQ